MIAFNFNKPFSSVFVCIIVTLAFLSCRNNIRKTNVEDSAIHEKLFYCSLDSERISIYGPNTRCPRWCIKYKLNNLDNCYFDSLYVKLRNINNQKYMLIGGFRLNDFTIELESYRIKDSLADVNASSMFRTFNEEIRIIKKGYNIELVELPSKRINQQTSDGNTQELLISVIDQIGIIKGKNDYFLVVDRIGGSSSFTEEFYLISLKGKIVYSQISSKYNDPIIKGNIFNYLKAKDISSNGYPQGNYSTVSFLDFSEFRKNFCTIKSKLPQNINIAKNLVQIK